MPKAMRWGTTPTGPMGMAVMAMRMRSYGCPVETLSGCCPPQREGGHEREPSTRQAGSLVLSGIMLELVSARHSGARVEGVRVEGVNERRVRRL